MLWVWTRTKGDSTFDKSPLVNEKWYSSLTLSFQTISLNSPNSFLIIFLLMASIVESDESLKSIRSAIVPTFILCFSPNWIRSSLRAIVPSSFIISQITPADWKPASLARSHAASVCPALLRTPPSIAFKGKIWPGWTISEALEFLSTTVLIVWALSAAEIPVVIPSAASMETVKAVLLAALFLLVIILRSNLFIKSLLSGRQIKPFPLEAIKLIISGVTLSAAQTKSPSFSRDSSSRIITIFPSWISWMMSFILSFNTLCIFFLYLIQFYRTILV